jgi:hypothetical protein
MRPLRAVVAVMAVIIALLAWALIYYSRDELGTQAEKHEDQIKNVSTAGLENGRPVVRISAESQKAAGIAVQRLESAQREAARDAYGLVVNMQPLAELRGRYLAAAAESRAARAALAAAESESRRMEMLFRDDRNVFGAGHESRAGASSVRARAAGGGRPGRDQHSRRHSRHLGRSRDRLGGQPRFANHAFAASADGFPGAAGVSLRPSARGGCAGRSWSRRQWLAQARIRPALSPILRKSIRRFPGKPIFIW